MSLFECFRLIKHYGLGLGWGGVDLDLDSDGVDSTTTLHSSTHLVIPTSPNKEHIYRRRQEHPFDGTVCGDPLQEEV